MQNIFNFKLIIYFTITLSNKKYYTPRHRVEMEEIFDTVLRPETMHNDMKLYVQHNIKENKT